MESKWSRGSDVACQIHKGGEMVCGGDLVEGQKTNNNVGLNCNNTMALYSRDQGLMGVLKLCVSVHTLPVDVYTNRRGNDEEGG